MKRKDLLLEILVTVTVASQIQRGHRSRWSPVTDHISAKPALRGQAVTPSTVRRGWGKAKDISARRPTWSSGRFGQPARRRSCGGAIDIHRPDWRNRS